MEFTKDGSPIHPTTHGDNVRALPKRYGTYHLRSKGIAVPPATPSPNWKETLRQSCLQRAKQSRLDLIRRKRQENDLFRFMEVDVTKENEAIHHARVLVEEGLREYGVAMEGSNNIDENNHQIDFAIDSLHADSYDATRTDKEEILRQTTQLQERNDSPSDHCYCISEEEFIELLQEVDDELHRNELLLEEELEYERIEQEQQLQYQIADYEEWASQSNAADDNPLESLCIPCPLCQGLPQHHHGVITTVDGNQIFVCSNFLNGNCELRVPSNGLALQQLYDRFRSIYDHHHDLACTGLLVFQVMMNGTLWSNSKQLVATCSCCGLNATVL